jgi:hypothetical protein
LVLTLPLRGERAVVDELPELYPDAVPDEGRVLYPEAVPDDVAVPEDVLEL